MAQEFLLQQNVLSDNVLILPNKGKIFKGGYVGIIKEYVFETSWSDKEIVKRFRSKERLSSYLNKKYPKTQYEYDFSDTCLG
jgi:hypothetical protein